MAKASDNIFPKIIESMQTANPAAPSDSSWKIFAKADGIYARSSNAVAGPFGSGAGATITTQDEGGTLSSTVTTLNFVGSGVVASGAGATTTVTIAGGGGGDYIRLGEEVLGSAAATLTVTGISSSYRDLICVFKVRSAQSPIDQFRLRVGSGSIDTGGNYAHYTVTVGTDAGTAAAISGTSSQLGYCPSAGLAANIFCTGQIEMVDYVSASHTKSFQWKSSFYSQPDNWTDTNNGGGSWTGTTAIDQVRLITNSGANFATGSRLTVYGRA